MDILPEEQREHIRRSLETETTERLIEIWQADDRAEWTDEALGIAAAILQERLGALPQRIAVPAQDEKDNDAVVEADTYHDFDRVVRIASWARIGAWVCLALTPVHFVLNLTVRLTDVVYYGEGFRLMEMLRALLSTVGTLMASVFLFIFLQAISEWSYVLLDVEENTRRPTAHSGRTGEDR